MFRYFFFILLELVLMFKIAKVVGMEFFIFVREFVFLVIIY